MVGSIAGVRNFWVACGVMAGFCQGARIGLAMARWMVEGDPGMDVFGMDVARFRSDVAQGVQMRWFLQHLPSQEVSGQSTNANHSSRSLADADRAVSEALRTFCSFTL